MILQVKKISDKRKVQNFEYYELRTEFLAKNEVCQMNFVGCTYYAQDVHHIYNGANRSKYYLEKSTWKAACRSCHTYLHSNLSRADGVALGLLK